MNITTTKRLDTGELEERVKRMYEEVALEPERLGVEGLGGLQALARQRRGDGELRQHGDLRGGHPAA